MDSALGTCHADTQKNAKIDPLRYLPHSLLASRLSYGILYAPAQALLFGLNFEETLAWIASGAVFDVLHGIGNFIAGWLTVPLAALMNKMLKKSGFYS